jgi:hypothetical protein
MWQRPMLENEQPIETYWYGIDFPTIIAALEELGYAGYVTVHQAALFTPQEDAGRSAQYLRSIGHFEPAVDAMNSRPRSNSSVSPNIDRNNRAK